MNETRFLTTGDGSGRREKERERREKRGERKERAAPERQQRGHLIQGISGYSLPLYIEAHDLNDSCT